MRSIESYRAWAALGWAALALLVVGGADFLLTWYPPDFGNREWEFGTVTSSLNGLPILLLGIGLLLAASIQTDRRWWTALAAAAAFVMVLWVLAAAVLWATNVPLALRSVPAELAAGIRKSLVRTTVQVVVYPLVLAYLAMRSIGAMRRGERDV